MQTFTDVQRTWSGILREPWKIAKLVGNSSVAQEEILKLMRQSGKLQVGGQGSECISALLIGENGVGKSFVVRTAIEKLSEEGNLVIPITLHGSMGLDDRSSMRHIFSQFQRYLVGGSSIDTLSRSTFHIGSLSEWCDLLARLLQECSRSDHMVIITLEDFDAFCHNKSKQSLLYNLFDLMHLKDTRFLVLGITTRADAPELLEKRIKSRFQLRKILLNNPESFSDLTDIIQTVLCGGIMPLAELEPSCSGQSNNIVPARFARKRTVLSPPAVKSVSQETVETIKSTLSSKELKQHWSYFKDMGFTVKEFVTASISALLQVSGPNDVRDALLNCMSHYQSKNVGDMGVVNSLLPSLTLRDHIVLISLLKLHQDQKKPKSFAHILKQIGSFEKSNHITTACRHSARAYWNSFQELVRLGLIEMVEHTAGSATSGLIPPPKFCKCRLTIAKTYSSLFRTTRAEGDDPCMSIVPNEVHQWANRHKDMALES